MLVPLVLLVAIVTVTLSAHVAIDPIKKESRLWERSGKFQGDMVLPKSIAKNGLPISMGQRWPRNELVIKYGSSLTNDEKWEIYYALNEIYEKSGKCVSFREAGSNDRAYVNVESNQEGCWAIVGFTGTKQDMNLQKNGCFSRGTIMHELLHAYGFFHMQSDPSRDNYVNINWQNMDNNVHDQFDKMDYLDRFGVPYDLKSIMHYSRMSFSNNGQPTIVAKSDYNMELGGESLTGSDIKKLRKMYGCE